VSGRLKMKNSPTHAPGTLSFCLLKWTKSFSDHPFNLRCLLRFHLCPGEETVLKYYAKHWCTLTPPNHSRNHRAKMVSSASRDSNLIVGPETFRSPFAYSALGLFGLADTEPTRCGSAGGVNGRAPNIQGLKRGERNRPKTCCSKENLLVVGFDESRVGCCRKGRKTSPKKGWRGNSVERGGKYTSKLLGDMGACPASFNWGGGGQASCGGSVANCWKVTNIACGDGPGQYCLTPWKRGDRG